MNAAWDKRIRNYRHNSHLGTLTRAIRSIEVNTLHSDTITVYTRQEIEIALAHLNIAIEQIRTFRIEADGTKTKVKHYPKRARYQRII